MAYIFLDESGDLGFNFKKKRTSRFFVVTFLLIPDSKSPFEKIIKKTHAEVYRITKRRIGVLHAVNEKPITRRRLLKRLSGKDCSIMVVYLDKQRVLAKLQDEKVILYNYIANILLDRVYTKRFISPDGPIELIASRRETNRFLNENFKDYLRNTFRYKHKGITRISIKTPEEEKGLQVVDFVSWAIFLPPEF